MLTFGGSWFYHSLLMFYVIYLMDWYILGVMLLKLFYVIYFNVLMHKYYVFLQVLDLRGNNIRVLSNNMFLDYGITNLQRLYCSYCKISEGRNTYFSRSLSWKYKYFFHFFMPRAHRYFWPISYFFKIAYTSKIYKSTNHTTMFYHWKKN